MKNIILFSTILAAGTLAANAASNIPVSLQNENLVLYWNFDSGNTPNKKPDGVTLESLFGYEIGSGYGAANSSDTRTYSSNFSLSGIKANSFTVSFDISNFVADDGHYLFSMYTYESESFIDNLVLGKDSGEEISFEVGGFGGYSDINAVVSDLNYSTLSSEKWTTITISSDGDNIKLYLDGVLKAGNTFILPTTNIDITGFRFGGLLGEDGWSTSAYFDNIAFWNKPLEDDEIASLVPEPSMFGLLAGIGVLALAGTRRRRR